MNTVQMDILIPLLALLALYAIGWFVLPIQKYTKSIGNKSGNNTAFKAYTHPNARYPEAVMAQEVYEARAKYRVIDVFRKSRYQRQVEGAEVTVQAAQIMYGIADKANHRADKAESFVKYKAGMLPKGHDVHDVDADMEQFSAKARKWVRRNLKLIKRA